jgi:hypothetical protein
MFSWVSTALLLFLFLFHGCTGPGSGTTARLQHRAVGSAPETIALYEAWFGLPEHISVGYSSQDPAVLKQQIHHAQAMGISAFVVDWYGDREPFIDRAYQLMQQAAAKNHFHIAMMYDETDADDGATDETIADFTMFHDTYLAPNAPGHQAYLTYEGRPVIFIFPKGRHTDWTKVRAVVNRWQPAPLLIEENLPEPGDGGAFDGYYAWVSPGWVAPGQKAASQDGSNWGDQYLSNFYETMKKYPDKIIVGGAWAQFNDAKASWGLNRHISARCGQTFKDTLNYWHTEFPPDQPIPFLMLETWNDYEEGTAIERGLPTCSPDGAASSSASAAPPAPDRSKTQQ